MIKSLLVEDDLDLAGNIMDYLELEDIVCDHASNGVAALNFLSQQQYQVVVLDINLPRLDGLSVCETLRKQGNDTPVIMLTARDQLNDKLAGFERGADDYLVKPFAMEELIVRIHALAKRRSGQVTQLRYGPLQYDARLKEAKFDEALLKLSPIGLVIFERLLRVAPEPVSRESLIQAIWGDDCPDSNSLKVHIHNVRKALGVHGDLVQLQSQPHVGFKFALQEQA